MSDDMWGEVSWLLRKWENPSLCASLFLFIKLVVLTLLFSDFFFFFFSVSDRPLLEEHYQGRIKAAFKFALTIDDFYELVDPHHLYECCLGPEPFAYVLKKIS